MRKCSKCGERKQSNQFKKGGSNWCKDCYNQWQNERRQERNKDIEYLLERSCQEAQKRGQVGYRVPPYEDVLSEFKSWEAMYLYLRNDEQFWNQWERQGNIFFETEKQGDRPSIDRINSELGYVKGNMQCLSLSTNQAKGSSKPVEVFILDGMSLRGYDSQKEAMKAGIPLAVLNTGGIAVVDGKPMLIQSKALSDGKMELKQQETPKYLTVVRYTDNSAEAFFSDGLILRRPTANSSL